MINPTFHSTDQLYYFFYLEKRTTYTCLTFAQRLFQTVRAHILNVTFVAFLLHRDFKDSKQWTLKITTPKIYHFDFHLINNYYTLR